jgi:hypothetical protein
MNSLPIRILKFPSVGVDRDSLEWVFSSGVFYLRGAREQLAVVKVLVQLNLEVICS